MSYSTSMRYLESINNEPKMEVFMKKNIILALMVTLSIPLSPIYDQLLLDAQKKLNVSGNIPLLETNDPDVYGYATYNNIYLNKKLLDNTTYGFKRKVVFHETVHIKHQDSKIKYRSNLSIILGIPLSTYIILSRPLSPYTPIKIAASTYLIANLAFWSTHFYSKFCETRADTQAAMALECEDCLHEHITCYKKELIGAQISENERINQGYLSCAKFLEIKKSFKNKKCPYHQKSS